MMKLIKRLLLIIVILLSALTIFTFSFLNSIDYEVTADDLPTNVYETSGELMGFIDAKIVEFIFASDDDRYTLVEEIINLILLDSIRENINSEYDPLDDACEDYSCSRIVNEEYFYVDYLFAELNEDDQLVITLSAGTSKILERSTALIMVFDIEFDLSLEMNIILTLDTYNLGDRNLSLKILDYIFDRLDKDSIEASMTKGTLDLDEYTFTISLVDYIFG